MATNNPALYNAVAMGLMNGAVATSFPKSANPLTYFPLATVAQEFAALVDSGIPNDPAMNTDKATAMGQAVAAVMQGRYSLDLNSPDYTGLADAVIALYEAEISILEPDSSSISSIAVYTIVASYICDSRVDAEGNTIYDQEILANLGAPANVTMPKNTPGRVIGVQDVGNGGVGNAGVNNISVLPANGETVDGDPNGKLLDQNGMGRQYVCDEAGNWYSYTAR